MSDKEVKRWQTLQDGLDKLFMTSAPMPEPGKEEVLVEIQTVSLNYRDTEVAMGLYSHHKAISTGSPTPVVPCSDMCGVVVATGPDSQWRVGDRVTAIHNLTHMTGQIRPYHQAQGLGLPLDGVLQTHIVLPDRGLVRVPDHLTDEEASCLPIAGVTAWMAINGMRPMGQPGGEGEVVLLQGTGGVSIAGLQIAKASGATTIITSSSDEKLERAKALGADYGINYRTAPHWADEVMKITNGEGADIIFENGGAKTIRQSFDAIAFGGLINCIGYVSGKIDDPEDRTNVNVLCLRRTVTLKGILNGPKDRFEEMVDFYTKHQIKPVVDKVFPFEESKEAMKYLYSGSHFGKVVIKVKG